MLLKWPLSPSRPAARREATIPFKKAPVAETAGSERYDRKLKCRASPGRRQCRESESAGKGKSPLSSGKGSSPSPLVAQCRSLRPSPSLSHSNKPPSSRQLLRRGWDGRVLGGERKRAIVKCISLRRPRWRGGGPGGGGPSRRRQSDGVERRLRGERDQRGDPFSTQSHGALRHPAEGSHHRHSHAGPLGLLLCANAQSLVSNIETVAAISSSLSSLSLACIHKPTTWLR